MLAVTYQDQVLNAIEGFAEFKVLGGKSQNVAQFGDGAGYDSSRPANISDDQLLGGFLDSGYDMRILLKQIPIFPIPQTFTL
ncbi:conserved hypothetical protein [Ricinus communis]|uniref:Uncharacterized protein n=1 Tax=Ricinus communis TaxID=3988 RepID=B9SHU3_RICCO|nr:conserved hypothetical protein [Ricinus communis]